MALQHSQVGQDGLHPIPMAPTVTDTQNGSADQLLDRLQTALRALVAVGASAAGATALLLVAGATYYQSLLEGLGANWAVDAVGYAAMIHAGALNTQLFIITTMLTCAMVVGGIVSWRGIWWGVGLSAMTVAVCTGVPWQWPDVLNGHGTYWWTLINSVATAYIVALLLTALLVRRPANPTERGALLMATGIVCILGLILIPIHLGTVEAARVRTGFARSLHPDVCLKDDPLHAWRLVRNLGDAYLLTAPKGNATRFRVAVQADIASFLVSFPDQPREGGPPSLACPQ